MRLPTEDALPARRRRDTRRRLLRCRRALVAGCSPGPPSKRLDRAFPPPLPAKLAVSTEVVDRDGAAAARLCDAGRPLAARHHASTRSIRNFVKMLVAYEDKRFWDHSGVDLLALLRAATQFAGNGRIVSGGSTLSMQLARLIEPRESRSFGQKLRQIFRAIQIERRLSKQRDPRALPDARALWRQPRRHARRLARLFRQGAEAADRLGSRPAGGAAATARAAPPRPQPRRRAGRARPRAGPHGQRRPARRAGGRARRARRRFGRPPRPARACRPCRRCGAAQPSRRNAATS